MIDRKGVYKKLLFRVKFSLLIVVKLVFPIVFLFFVLNFLFPLKVNIDYSKVIYDREGRTVHTYLTEDDKWRIKAGLDEITPELRKAIILKEDKYFYYHPGINPFSLVRAVYKNIISNRRVSGASTISMQLARLLHPAARTYTNKVIEMFRALQLEWYYSKDEILQMYLNLVPYGGNIEGVKSASLLYFEQEPEALSLSQILALSVIPNKPTSLRPGKNNQKLVAFRNKWLNYFLEKGYYSELEIQTALAEPLIMQRHAAPDDLPHLSRRLANKIDDVEVFTTVNMEIQKDVELLCKNYIGRIRHRNIGNCAVLVLDNKTREAVAYVGSSDFYDLLSQGQVDGVQAVRSPGSTLKPFLYALVMDKGMVTPASILPDVPVDIGGWTPENYDEKFKGRVSVEEALSLSLNVPAVRLLDDLGLATFTKFLIASSCETIEQQQEDLGLSLILGGCGNTLEELTNMYAMLADGGNYKPIRYTVNQKEVTAQKLLSSGSVWMVGNILTMLQRPDLRMNFEKSKNLPKISWKTGTSYGRRDAWSIGFNTSYSVGVWVGNFAGNGVPDLNGAGYATPLLFEVFHLLDYYRKASQFDIPDDIDIRLVCQDSGLPPSDSCTNQISDYYIPGVSSNTKCDHLKEVYVNANEDISYCKSCLPAQGYKIKSYPNLAPEIIAYYEYEHIPYHSIPNHNPKCTRLFEEQGPEINSLTDGATYYLLRDESNRLKLSCLAQNDVSHLYWYIDDVFYKKVATGEELFFSPRSGRIKISCVDDKGRTSHIFVSVAYVG